MSISSRLNHVYYEAKANKWYHYFAVFCRIMLALAFVISGLVKVNGERFAAGLPANHPLGQYFESLHQTGYYYTFIGISQLFIAVLLLIPRTALLGALMYFPVILNICILTYAVRFEGTRVTTFMLLANLYLLCWDYDRIKYSLKYTLSSKQVEEADSAAGKKLLRNKFPFLFFGSVVAVIAAVIIINMYLYDIRPGNSPEECINGCPGNKDPKACAAFCDCIYNQGKPLHDCLTEYNKAVN
ncbi:DoxX family protein [Fulvivirgaceae bacterium PWU4]|uniref:DoxX family protein n=1 Tax=Chryseosolibacter histidini TaxID=2782349 RepID=A0AAP2DI10_9BACT|nr:DoxX family protein [Chryseosolibacter histidini]MBT1696671.1 DoxX family protein [Chryseosolibacter histidini]